MTRWRRGAAFPFCCAGPVGPCAHKPLHPSVDGRMIFRAILFAVRRVGFQPAVPAAGAPETCVVPRCIDSVDRGIFVDANPVQGQAAVAVVPVLRSELGCGVPPLGDAEQQCVVVFRRSGDL